MSFLERFLPPRIEIIEASHVRIPGKVLSERRTPVILARVNLEKGQIPVLFLVDTGAQMSLIMPQDHERLGIVFDDKQATKSVGFYEEYIMRCMIQELPLSFSGFTSDQEASRKKPLISIRTVVNFYVPDPQQAADPHLSILGRDVLSLFNLTYDRDSVALETDGNPNPKLEIYRIRGRYFK